MEITLLDAAINLSIAMVVFAIGVLSCLIIHPYKVE